MIHLFLFDVDDVMVEARGYLKALQDTVAHFSHQMGLGDHPPTEEEVRTFEANGLTSEWDSGATCVAALLLERLRQEPSLSLPPRWPDALSMLAAHPHPISHSDYAALARKVGERLSVKDPEGEEGVSPARAAIFVHQAGHLRRREKESLGGETQVHAHPQVWVIIRTPGHPPLWACSP